MEKQFNSPVEVVEMSLNAGVDKAGQPFLKMLLLGIMSGAFVALGGAASSTAVHSIPNVGIDRLIIGIIFPVGLMMIIFTGGELFTGNCLMLMGVLDKKISIKAFTRNLVVVYFSNLIGALLVSGLLYISGNLNYTDGLLGAYAIKTAVGKVAITPLKGIASGILCNILVCVAVILSTASRDIVGKIWAIFFPIMVFVVSGIEHCIANMFFIPIGIMAAQNPTYVAKAQEAYGLLPEQIESLTILNSLGNFIPVTIGNIIGGMLCVALPLFVAHSKHWDTTN